LSSAPIAAHAQVRYLALGDSFTIGTGSSPAEAFPAKLTEAWDDTCAVALTNVAKNGYTSEDLVEKELPALESVKPSFVTIAIGANDIVQHVPEDRYRENLEKIFAAVRGAGVAPDHTIALPQPDWSVSPAARSFGVPSEIRARIERYNELLAQAAKSGGARYVDLYPLMRDLADQHELAPDQLHPSAEAHRQWAVSLEKALESCTSFAR
jgi:acyl-CoA thioesterase-1